MLIRDLMTLMPITVSPETTIFDAREIMDRARIRHLLVTRNGVLAGIVTDRDIRLNLPSPATSLSLCELNYLLRRLTVDRVMSAPVVTIGPDANVREAAAVILERRIGALPVLAGMRIVGILTETDLVRAFALGAETTTAMAGSPR
jgi:acetoin utilization protein AcuB